METPENTRPTPADGHALREQLLDAPAAAQLAERGEAVRDEPRAEGRQAQLRHRAVVQDLRANVHVLHVVLQQQANYVKRQHRMRKQL